MKTIENSHLECLKHPIGYHIARNLEVIQILCKEVCTVVKSQQKDKVIIYCMGSSGAIISTLLSITMIELCDITPMIIHLKKDGEYSHDHNDYINDNNNFNIIIDDFIVSGRTLNTTYSKINYTGTNMPVIDLIAISGYIALRKLEFKPLCIIAQEINTDE